MSTLPVTVLSVENIGGTSWSVAVAMADGTTAHYVIPESLATIKGVSISALAMAQLLDAPPQRANAHHGVHARYAPRTLA